MDNDDPQHQLLLLICDFSAAKTKGERTLSYLKKRLLEFQVDYEAASAKFEQTKWVRKAAERELRGSQAQLDRTKASLLAMETRNSGLQDEISQLSSKLQAIKNDDKIQRDEFIRAMLELNSKLSWRPDCRNTFPCIITISCMPLLQTVLPLKSKMKIYMIYFVAYFSIKRQCQQGRKKGFIARQFLKFCPNCLT